MCLYSVALRLLREVASFRDSASNASERMQSVVPWKSLANWLINKTAIHYRVFVSYNAWRLDFHNLFFP